MGYQCFLVLEMPSELPLILERAEKLNVRPLIGVRIKVSTKAGGQWTDSGGDRSVFGLNMAQIVEVVDQLRARGMLDCLQLVHYQHRLPDPEHPRHPFRHPGGLPRLCGTGGGGSGHGASGPRRRARGRLRRIAHKFRGKPQLLLWTNTALTSSRRSWRHATPRASDTPL